MLRRGPLGAPGQQVLEIGGHFAYYAARIGRNTGDRRLAAGFGHLAAQYADVSGDPLLIASVACNRSIVAFDAARYDEAAAVAGRAIAQAHPSCKARLFSHQARALAAGGHADEAREALAGMRAHMVDLPPMPGVGRFDEGELLGHSAMVLVELGDDREAESLARERLAGTPADEDYLARGVNWLTIGKALAGRDPGAAADAGLSAHEANRVWPESSVETRVRQLHRNLSREHGKVAEVVRLGEACTTLRPAETRPTASGGDHHRWCQS
jgi:hypothetical protein